MFPTPSIQTEVPTDGGFENERRGPVPKGPSGVTDGGYTVVTRARPRLFTFSE